MEEDEKERWGDAKDQRIHEQRKIIKRLQEILDGSKEKYREKLLIDAEKQVREQQLIIERLKREIAELKSKGSKT